MKSFPRRPDGWFSFPQQASTAEDTYRVWSDSVSPVRLPRTFEVGWQSGGSGSVNFPIKGKGASLGLAWRSQRSSYVWRADGCRAEFSGFTRVAQHRQARLQSGKQGSM